jgi:5-methylcytosine-specific restriction endonuclease McrA
VTRTRAERLTGYDVRRISDDSSGFCYGAFCGDDLVAMAEHSKEGIALTLLVNRVYQIHSRKVLESQGWKCSRCGRSHGLQIHHRTFRSHGGTHRPENLEPVCWDCHRRIHARQIDNQ